MSQQEEHAAYLQNLAMIRRNLENARNFLAMATIELERMEKIAAQTTNPVPTVVTEVVKPPEPAKVEVVQEPLVTASC